MIVDISGVFLLLVFLLLAKNIWALIRQDTSNEY